uniref:Uncharacterized protein n=1 Tax=viral metagenome TaxID=1070528 RepID=A0A6C0F0B8_9ZZZZ
MGNSISTASTKSNNNVAAGLPKDLPLGETLDYIATHYILTMDFQSLRKLYEKQYCEKMVVLTSNIINKYFTDLELSHLAHRIENGSGMGDNGAPENIIFFKKTDIEHLNIPDIHKKEAVCNKIAKFYIKIAHLFSAIVTTINPEYVYKDMFGNVIKQNLYEKDNIPKWAKVEVLKLNLCDNRINALKGETPASMMKNVEAELTTPGMTWGGDGSDPATATPAEKPIGEPDEPNELSDSNKDEIIKIQPDVCSINLKKDGTLKTLEEEPGIPELMDLYYDDEYDYKTGKFKGMSNTTKEKFHSDLKRFYSEFSGNIEMPDTITKFSDIKLRDYSKQPICDKKFVDQKNSFSGTYNDTLLADYANNLKQMIKSVNKKQQQLLTIINRLFVYVVDPETKVELIKVNPELTDISLQSIVEETRNIIIELYLKCEADFVEGVKLYEAIVEAQIFVTTQNQIESLKRAAEVLYNPLVEEK